MPEGWCFSLLRCSVSREMLGGILERIGRLRLGSLASPTLGASGLVTVTGSHRAKELPKGETWA